MLLTLKNDARRYGFIMPAPERLHKVSTIKNTNIVKCANNSHSCNPPCLINGRDSTVPSLESFLLLIRLHSRWHVSSLYFMKE